ncbi:MAG: hypothetical protein J0M36_12800 [Caulobacterales bacterium]|nr:hypothetical protein [Caulobacterales bacterium]
MAEGRGRTPPRGSGGGSNSLELDLRPPRSGSAGRAPPRARAAWPPAPAPGRRSPPACRHRRRRPPRSRRRDPPVEHLRPEAGADPKLKEILGEIELRAAVELAKLDVSR